VPIGTEHGEASEISHLVVALFVTPAQSDVSPPPRHVGRDRHRAYRARIGHDLRLLLVLPGVEDTTRHTGGAHQTGEPLGLHDGSRPPGLALSPDGL
jgi:hypothetical protein